MSENGNNHAFISLVENFLARIRLLHRGGGGGGGFMYTLRDAQCLADKKKKKKKLRIFSYFIGVWGILNFTKLKRHSI